MRLTLDLAEMPIAVIHRYLADESYWARGIPESVLQRALLNSVCACVLDGTSLAGFARVVTDRATFAYVCDVFVLPEYRGRGISHQLMRAFETHPELQGLRRWMLMTRDAHTLYAQHGFTSLADATRAMERHDPGVYQRANRNQ
jgi:GNAT superfamily N-acetyltransferase